jgi:hypothetical protein
MAGLVEAVGAVDRMVALRYAIPQWAVPRLFGDWVARDAVRRFNCRWLNPMMVLV